MIISGKPCKEIIIKTKDNELVASITDANIITKKGYKVELVPPKVTKADELKELAKPISQYLRNNCHPHMSVVITDESVNLEETVIHMNIDEEVIDYAKNSRR